MLACKKTFFDWKMPVTEKNFLKDIFFVNLGILALWVGSNIAIPLKPVPVVFSDMVVLLIGLFFSRNQAFFALSSFLVLGTMGLPLFSNGTSGPGILFGPTGGYLAGFWLAAVTMAFVRDYFSLQSLFSFVCLSLLGSSIIIGCGMLGLSAFMLFNIKKAYLLGVLPFLPIGLFKALLAAFLAKTRGLKWRKKNSDDPSS